MAISKECKPDNFESHSSLKPSFKNIRGLCLNFVECESFLKSNSPEILNLCVTNLDDSIDSGNFSVTGYLSLMTFLLPFLDVTRMPMSRVLFLAQLNSGILCP